MKIVLVTGGFDPLHSGHISYFKDARNLGDILIVGVNSDEWLARKKGKSFMNIEERIEIIKNIKSVGGVIRFNDDDDTAKNAITKVRLNFPYDKIIFANGGDRTKDNIPEMDINDENLQFAFGVGGGDKKNSSSWILEEWKFPKTERPWGYYKVLYELPTLKVKELVVKPFMSLSMQKHNERNEHWHVVSGIGNVKIKDSTTEKEMILKKDSTLNIPIGVWHKLSNMDKEDLHIIEIQYGTKCVEEDIERE